MTKVTEGDTIQMHYTGKLADGTVFDSSDGKDPLEFQAGKGMLVPGLDRELVGMEVGEKKTVNVAFAEGYGAHDPSQIHKLERSKIPGDVELSVGQHLQMQASNGQVLRVNVIELTDDAVTIDANHFLAGKDLVFDIELVAINPS